MLLKSDLEDQYALFGYVPGFDRAERQLGTYTLPVACTVKICDDRK